MILKPHQRLAQIRERHSGFIGRLQRRFGIGDYVHKWCRDCEGTGTGHPSPLQRVRDMIDEAWIEDPSGQSAQLIASDAPEYNESIIYSRVEVQTHGEVKSKLDDLLVQTTEAICACKRENLEHMSTAQLQKLMEELGHVPVAVNQLQAIVNLVLTVRARNSDSVQPMRTASLKVR